MGRTRDYCWRTWHIYRVEHLKEFRATEGSTEVAPSVFGVETALWSTAAKKAGRWYRGVLEAAQRFMVKWHEDEAELSRQRRASAVVGVRGNRGRGSKMRTGKKPDQGNAGRGGRQEVLQE